MKQCFYPIKILQNLQIFGVQNPVTLEMTKSLELYHFDMI